MQKIVKNLQLAAPKNAFKIVQHTQTRSKGIVRNKQFTDKSRIWQISIKVLNRDRGNIGNMNS